MKTACAFHKYTQFKIVYWKHNCTIQLLRTEEILRVLSIQEHRGCRLSLCSEYTEYEQTHREMLLLKGVKVIIWTFFYENERKQITNRL